MKITCPSCCAQFPIEAGLLEDEGKRLAAVVADMEPVLARAALGYLRLFRPPKTALRMARAAKILRELAELVGTGTVCRDERSGVRRRATPAMWATGIEQMLQQRSSSLQLPLSNHNYLRALVYGIADSADATNERSREKALRRGERPAAEPGAVDDHLQGLKGMLARKFISQADYDQQVADYNARKGK